MPCVAQPSNEATAVAPTNATRLIPPPPPSPKSPVELFRELLAMAPVERQRSLAGRSPENRKLILDKIREYQALSPDDRELRLEVTELRWYLWPLMKVDPTNRVARLESMPAEMRKLVEARLRMWDLLPPPLQRDVLQNESVARYFSEIAAGTASRATPSAQVRTNMATWGAMSEDKRREISQLFNSFFGLRAEEQAKVLRRLSPEESRQIEKTLETFQGLTPRQRSTCIRSFGKFASLGPAERKRFLENAQKWEQMAPADRQIFRELVEQTSLQPPFPTMVPPMPPPPRHMAPRRIDTATNN